MAQKQRFAIIYARVSSADQDNERQKRDLAKFGMAQGFEIYKTFTEVASGTKGDRAVRKQAMEFAVSKKIDAILVTEMSRWSRSTLDLISTLQYLGDKGISLIAQHGMSFELDTAHGKMIATVMAAIAEFERDLLSERVKSGLQQARANGKRLGRPKGFHPVNAKAAAVLKMIDAGTSVRKTAEALKMSPSTVQSIKQKHGEKAG